MLEYLWANMLEINYLDMSKKDNRTKFVATRLTKSEQLKVDLYANQMGMKRGEFIRHRILN
jgi:hypothetical protein